MDFMNQPVFEYLVQYAYQPGWVYTAVVLLMVASSFGLPLPEEITLLSLGWLAFMGSRPDLFPPPASGGEPINVYTACTVAFVAIIASDFAIFNMGRIWGRKILYHEKIQKVIKRESLQKVESWTKKYGVFAAFIFRFTPGLRFPGHLACGSMGMSPVKFLAVDFFAAGISVPTQIYLLATYGEPILRALQEAKFIFFGIIGVLILVVLILKWTKKTPQTS
ncbi:MAG: DedA family protein [Bdellovibrionales bacterium]